MKRVKFLNYLKANNCYLLREGEKHSWWVNLDNNSRSSIPRHVEISDNLCKKICKDLGIQQIK